jgi:hypothetical protein
VLRFSLNSSLEQIKVPRMPGAAAWRRSSGPKPRDKVTLLNCEPMIFQMGFFCLRVNSMTSIEPKTRSIRAGG